MEAQSSLLGHSQKRGRCFGAAVLQEAEAGVGQAAEPLLSCANTELSFFCHKPEGIWFLV